ncbi:MAG: TIGR04282 family arsenosugar biosynthesis glycosyltransferase [Porticoccaceae bacterium]
MTGLYPKTFLYPEALIIQFAKAPVVGQVKTRMQPHLNAEQCADLHRRLVSHTFHKLLSEKVAPVELWVGGEDAEGFFTELVSGAKSYVDVDVEADGTGADDSGEPGRSPTIVAQSGKDLGERMYRAFEQALTRSRPVILVGSDCPFFSKDYFTTAIEFLHSGQDAVLGPAEDGGYVMMGLNRVSPALFHSIDWGSAQVLAQTRERLAEQGWQWREMPPLADIDEPKDLVRLEDLGVI